MQEYSIYKDENFFKSYRKLIEDYDGLRYEDKIYLNALLDVLENKVESVFHEFIKRANKEDKSNEKTKIC